MALWPEPFSSRCWGSRSRDRKKVGTSVGVRRRDLLRAGAGALAGWRGELAAAPQPPRTRRVRKKVLVAGGGVAGLSCAYELTKLGHNTVVLEAGGRTGGHVRTLKDDFADGLYADVGAEHFYYPGYTRYWAYLREFGLTELPYPRRDHLIRFFQGRAFPEEALRTRSVLQELAFSPAECVFLAEHPWPELPFLYLNRYVEQIRDERNPFERGLGGLDELSVADLLRKEGASAGALRFFGGSGSALHAILGGRPSRNSAARPWKRKSCFAWPEAIK